MALGKPDDLPYGQKNDGEDYPKGNSQRNTERLRLDSLKIRGTVALKVEPDPNYSFR